MSYYGRQQNQKRSEATEQEALIAWCGWQQNQHPELMIRIIPSRFVVCQ